MPGKAKLTVYQDSTFRRIFTYKKTLPVDLTGSHIYFDIVPSTGSPINYSTETGHVVLTAPTEGKFTITITDEETNAYTWTSGKYNIHLEFPNGEQYRLLEGVIKVSKRV